MRSPRSRLNVFSIQLPDLVKKQTGSVHTKKKVDGFLGCMQNIFWVKSIVCCELDSHFVGDAEVVAKPVSLQCKNSNITFCSLNRKFIEVGRDVLGI